MLLFVSGFCAGIAYCLLDEKEYALGLMVALLSAANLGGAIVKLAY